MRGLLMIEPLYHQTIAGKKTMTRRSGGLDAVNIKPDRWWLYQQIEGNALFRFDQSKQRNPNHTMEEFCKSRYRVGEVLYIKEPTAIKTNHAPYPFTEPNTQEIVYKYNHEYDDDRIKWNNKLFMPASAARAFIRITGIKCERLMDISDADCIAEGIESDDMLHDELTCYKIYGKLNPNSDGSFTTAINNPKKSFISLYKFANKVKEVPNIWCWCYSFEYLPNYKIDQNAKS